MELTSFRPTKFSRSVVAQMPAWKDRRPAACRTRLAATREIYPGQKYSNQARYRRNHGIGLTAKGLPAKVFTSRCGSALTHCAPRDPPLPWVTGRFPARHVLDQDTSDLTSQTPVWKFEAVTHRASAMAATAP